MVEKSQLGTKITYKLTKTQSEELVAAIRAQVERYCLDLLKESDPGFEIDSHERLVELFVQNLEWAIHKNLLAFPGLVEGGEAFDGFHLAAEQVDLLTRLIHQTAADQCRVFANPATSEDCMENMRKAIWEGIRNCPHLSFQ